MNELTHIDTVLARASAEWQARVVESEEWGRERIRLYYLDGLEWGWLRRNVARWFGETRWCGSLPAYCWRGTLSRHVRVHYFASTDRLDRWCRLDPGLRWRPDDAQPGDIMVVGHRKAVGNHITTVIGAGWRDGKIQTIEGNAQGALPGGERTRPGSDGVVRRTRDIAEARYVVRPYGPWLEGGQ